MPVPLTPLALAVLAARVRAVAGITKAKTVTKDFAEGGAPPIVAKAKPATKPKPTTKPKPLTNKQKTYQIRGAQDKMERELLESGGRPSREWLEELRKQTFPHLYKSK